MDLLQLSNLLPLLALLSWAAVIDLRRGRIPNWLTASLVLTGLLASLLPGRSVGPAQSSLGLLAGFGPPFVLFAIGALGAGDVKLLAAIGAWIGPGPVIDVMILSAIAAAVLAVFQSLWQGRLLLVLNGTMATALTMLSQPKLAVDQQRDALRSAGPGQKLPYGLPIWIGTVLVLLMPMACFWRGH